MSWPFRRKYKCGIFVATAGQFCGQPAVACVILFDQRTLVCRWHVEPLEEHGVNFRALAFLARSLVPPP